MDILGEFFPVEEVRSIIGLVNQEGVVCVCPNFGAFLSGLGGHPLAQADWVLESGQSDAFGCPFEFFISSISCWSLRTGVTRKTACCGSGRMFLQWADEFGHMESSAIESSA